MKNIYLIDGNALIYRMFYAMPDFTTKDGKHVGALFGVAKFFIQDLVRDNPDYVVFVRDAKGKNFRHEIYSEYKATRDRMPDNLRAQVDEINEMVSLFQTSVVEIPNVEADDVIATLAEIYGKDKNNRVLILSGDKDLYSLVTENIYIYDTIKKDLFNQKKTQEKFGVEAEKIIDYLAINGDSSDNIPGIDGIGPKKAVPLINKIGTVEEIYDFIDSEAVHSDEEIKKILSGKTLEKIKNAREIAFVSKKLATIKKDVELGDFLLEDYLFDKETLLNDKIIELFKKYDFNSLLGAEHIKKQKIWEDMGLGVKIIGDNDGLETLGKHISNSKQKEIIIKTQTTSDDIIKAELVGVSILINKEDIYYINVLHSGPKVDSNELMRFFKLILNGDFTIIGHNLKYDLELIDLFMQNSNKTNSKSLEYNFGQMSLID